QHRWRRIAVVEIDFGVGEVRQNEDLVLLRERHQILVEIEARDISGWIGWITDDDCERLGDRMDDGALDRLEELRCRLRGNRADHPASHQKSKGMDRIARIRAEK